MPHNYKINTVQFSALSFNTKCMFLIKAVITMTTLIRPFRAAIVANDQAGYLQGDIVQ